MSDFDFNDAHWHDAELRSVHVDRSKPGEADVVQLEVIWPDDLASLIRFHDCYRFECAMNFGVVAVETIREASVTTASTALDEVRRRWEATGVSLPDLKEFRISTNSTGSALVVFARSVDANPVPAVENEG
jgi:hypothetical protein